MTTTEIETIEAIIGRKAKEERAQATHSQSNFHLREGVRISARFQRLGAEKTTQVLELNLGSSSVTIFVDDDTRAYLADVLANAAEALREDSVA